jgi:arsenate reductase
MNNVMDGTRKRRILFLCTGNACRSQMAEGWARHLLGDTVEPYSAGITPRGLDPRAVQVMAETGVDISRQRSKHVDEFRDVQFDLVVTVCDNAREQCPLYLGSAKQMHQSFDDPAAATGNEEKVLSVFRRVRDELRALVEGLGRVERELSG